MSITRSLLPICATALILSSNVLALDARSIALGGSTVAHGKGVHGALENPATLLQLQDQGERGHFHLGVSLDLRDSANVISIVEDNPNLIDDLDAQISSISGQTLSCDVTTATPATVCLSNTAQLGSLSSTTLNILNDINGKDLDGQAALDIGYANSDTTIPFAIHLRSMVTGIATPEIADGDIAYTTAIADTLQDDQLTFGEILDNTEFAIATTGLALSLVQPSDTFESTAEVAALLRTQIGLSLARRFTLNDHDFDIGITPKFSLLEAGFLNIDIAEQFEDNTTALADQFDQSKVDGTSATFDIGVSTNLIGKPLRVAAVARNVVSESISVNNYTFETTPQLIIGASYQLGRATINADLALNKAKLDNLESQKMGIGAEWKLSAISLRSGISHDAARNDASTALSLGAGLGPLQFGARLTETNEAQLALQLSHSY